MPLGESLGCSTFARHYSRNLFFSSRYLDVSVRAVPSHCWVTWFCHAGFPHSDIAGSYACTQLANTFRSVPRPSSALDAKASSVCPFALGFSGDTEIPILFAIGFCLLLRCAFEFAYVVVKVLSQQQAVESHIGLRQCCAGVGFDTHFSGVGALPPGHEPPTGCFPAAAP